MKKINVLSEFAPLKRVVVAQSEFIFPDKIVDADFLSDETLSLEGFGGKAFAEVYPLQHQIWEGERETLVKVLQKYGVEVLRPRKLTEVEKTLNKGYGASNFFVRDPFFTIGNFLIEGSLRFFHRRNEIFPVRDILSTEANINNVVYISVPRPDISNGFESEKGPFLEGGDVIVYEKNIFVGNSGLASNEAGYRWLKNLLEPQGYCVIQVPLLPNVLHLDCALSLVREGLMIVSEKALINGIPEIFSNWDKIIIDPKEIQYLTINGLPINENTYIADIAFKDSIGKELEKRGIKVEYIDFKISRSFGGSFRCSTQALLREY